MILSGGSRTTIVVSVGLLLATLSFSTSKAGNLDDAFILLVYVRHFAQSGSIYWNIEEGPVDGCTSILDMVVKAGLFKLVGGDLFALNWLVTLLALLIGTLCVYSLTRSLIRRFGTAAETTPLAMFATFAMATNRANAEGAKMLLETPLFLLMVLVSSAFLLIPRTFSPHGRIMLGVSWVLVALARPEGLALVAVAAVFFLWTQHTRLGFGALLLPVGIVSVVVGLYLAWHVLRFGYWAPNTYYAKTSDSRWNEIGDGFAYASSFVQTSPMWAIPALTSVLFTPLLALLSWRNSARQAFLFLSLSALVSLAVVVVSGGDLYWGLGRFFAPCTTLSLLAVVVAGIGLRGRARILAPTLMAVLVLGSLFSAWSSRELSIWPLDTASGLSGREINGVRHLRSIGVHTLAQTDYQRAKYYDDNLQVIDATGLNDRVAAHLPAPGEVLRGKGGMAYELSRRPDAISHGTQSHVSAIPMANYTSWELTRDAALVDRYLNTEAPQSLSEFDQLGHEYRATSYLADADRFDGDALNGPPRRSFMNVWLRNDIVAKLADPGIVVSLLRPDMVIDLDLAALDGFSRMEWDGNIPFRWTTGAAHIGVQRVVGVDCQVVITTWYGSMRFQVLWDSQLMARVGDGPRWKLPTNTTGSHVLEIDSDTRVAGDRKVGVLVTGVGILCRP